MAPGNPPRRVPRFLGGWIVPFSFALGIFWLLGPSWIFSPTTPTGGDLGLHVYPYSLLVDRLLPDGQVHGWSQGWLGGFPLFYYYFPLPGLIMAILEPILGFPVSMKLVVVSGVLLLAPAAWVLARALGFGGWLGGLAAAVGGSAVLVTSHGVLGGNLHSTMRGEFAYMWALSLGILYLAAITHATSGRRSALPAALLLAATALCHVIPTAAVVLAGVPLLLNREARRVVLVSWGLGFLLSAFWSVPFLLRMGLMYHPAWPLSLSPGSFFPPELLPVLPVAALGLAPFLSRKWKAVPLAVVMGAELVMILLPDRWFMTQRMLPWWYFGVHFLAGIGLAHALGFLLGTRSRRWAAATAGAVFLLGGILAVRGLGIHREAGRGSLGGYEVREAWPEYSTLMERAASLGAGRVHIEGDSAHRAYGSSMASALLPYWAGEDHPVLEGLWLQSSPTSPFVELAGFETGYRAPRNFRTRDEPTRFDLDRGVPHLGLLGVSHYLTVTEEAAQAAEERSDLFQVAQWGRWRAFRVTGSDLVTARRSPPMVWSGSQAWDEAALAWFRAADLQTPWMVREGPREWPRAAAVTQVVGAGPAGEGFETAIRDLRVEPERISFTTSAVGFPHLVRISWFPNWQAEGAEGPWRVAPSFMLLVPTQTEVRLEFRRTWVETAGWTGTSAGILLFGLLAFRRWRRRR